MKEKIIQEVFNKQSFFRNNFPLAIRHVENSSEYFNTGRRFLRDFWKITLITEGSGFWVVGDRKFPFRKNTLVIVHPDELTTWDIIGEKIVLYNIVFDKSLLPPELKYVSDPLHLQQIFSPDADLETVSPWQMMSAARNVCSLIRTMHKEFESSELNREYMLRLYFNQLILLLIRQSERKYRRHPAWVANYLRSYIKNNFTAEISLPQLSSELHLTRERLCRLYKEHCGVTIWQELNTLRVKKACELLRQGGLLLADICKASGFNDLSNFHRIFRAETGKTPRQYQRITSE
ncbi:MAG: helix-turn-helix domain-containing protein [Lentisphaerae bacterium]|nr:helix-turn-helix domain-containing protein [Lentisphaerota bacterium]MBR2720542.1 helix-turn-helix domain-containing protein [Lentisphaeria bacterium]